VNNIDNINNINALEKLSQSITKAIEKITHTHPHLIAQIKSAVEKGDMEILNTIKKQWEQQQ